MFLLVKITSEVSNLFDLSAQKYGIWTEGRDAVVFFCMLCVVDELRPETAAFSNNAEL